MNEAAIIIDEHRNNDFDIVAKLDDAGYKYKTKMLIDTITKSTYKLEVFNDRKDLVADAVFESEEGSGTMLKKLNWY